LNRLSSKSIFEHHCEGEARSNPILLKPQITILQSCILYLLVFGLFSYPFDKPAFVVLFVFFVAGLSKSGEPIIKFQLKTIRNL